MYYFDEEKDEINKWDIKIYGSLYAYAPLPIIKDNNEFYISQKIAKDIAKAMLNPETYEITSDSISSSFYVQGEDVIVSYNVNDGNFSEYIDIFQRMGDLD